MKVAYINSFYAPQEVGGAEKSVRFLAETMVAHGHQATVITLGAARESSQLHGVAIERLPIHNLYFPTEAGHQSAIRKLAWHTIDSYNLLGARSVGQVLDTIKPDVVHTNNLGGFSAAALSAIKQRGIAIVHTLRDYYFLCPNTAMFKDGKPCQSQCAKCKVLSTPRAAASQHVDAVVGNSQFILNKHLQHGLFRNASQHVIYNAYEPKVVENNRPTDCIQFGFIGRLAPTKGLEVLIDAVRHVRNQTSAPFQVLVAGDGDPDYVRTLKSQAAGLPVTFLGRTPPEALYNQVHWTIVPSVWDEPLARVLFESFSHGVPVIGSATGGTPELLNHEHLGHVYANALSGPDLADKMAAAMQSMATRYQAMQVHCSETSKRFRPQSVYQTYLDVYSAQAPLRSINQLA